MYSAKKVKGWPPPDKLMFLTYLHACIRLGSDYISAQYTVALVEFILRNTT